MRCAWLIILSTATLGCGDRLATVTGHVTLDGEPLAGGPELRGIVQFNPAGGSGVTATAYLDAEGKYRLATGSQDGIMPGPYEVAISATRIIYGQPGEAPSGRPVTLRRYAKAKDSGFTADVAPGRNTFDFELHSEVAK